MFYLYVPLITLIPSYFIRVHSYSVVSYSCSLCFTRVLLLFTLPFVFYSYSLCSLFLARVLLMFYSCSLLFTRVLLVFTQIHSCSLVFYLCSSVFIGVHWCSTRVHWCSLVFIRVPIRVVF